MEASSTGSFWTKIDKKGKESMGPYWAEISSNEAEINELSAVRERLLELGHQDCEIVPIYVLDDAISHLRSKTFLEKNLNLSNVIYYARGQNVSKMEVIPVTRKPFTVNILFEREKRPLLFAKRKGSIS